MNKNNFCVIMAGGVGSRFWPLSRTPMPKQFLDILGTGRTLIQQTFDRFRQICPVENIYVVTNSRYNELILEQIPELKPGQILGEPLRRNTAPCIAYANYKIKAINPDANIVVAPSDHLIMNQDEFVRIIKQGLDFTAQNQALLTLGMAPHRPETGYGYIQIESLKDLKNNESNIAKVKTFTEKPELEMAEMFLKSGDFFWNSGIFIWNLKSIMNAFDKHLNEVDSLFAAGIKKYNTEKEEEFINEIYPDCKNISIDFGIMEKANNVYVLCADFGWSDLGTWGSLFENSQRDENNNAIAGENVICRNVKNSIVNVPKDKLVALQDMDGYIVVESDGILLVSSMAEEQNIKHIVNHVKLNKAEKFL